MRELSLRLREFGRVFTWLLVMIASGTPEVSRLVKERSCSVRVEVAVLEVLGRMEVAVVEVFGRMEGCKGGGLAL